MLGMKDSASRIMLESQGWIESFWSGTLNSQCELHFFLLKSQALLKFPHLWSRQNNDIRKGFLGPIAWTEACLLLGSSNVLERLLCPDGAACCKPNCQPHLRNVWLSSKRVPTSPALGDSTIISPRGHVLPSHLAGNYFISWNTMTAALRKERRAYTMGSGNNRKLNARSETNPISSNMDLWKDSVQRL